MRIAQAVVLVAGVLVAVEACSGSSSNPLEPTQVDVAQLRTAIGDWANVPGHHGVSASVMFPDGTQWSGVAGRSGGSEVLRLDHLIAIASITKTLTGALILQMADEGRLTLDDPLSRWLSPRTNIDPAITVRQLLNHTNGLDNYTTSAALAQAAGSNPARVFSANELLDFVGPPHFPPGSQTEYTNTAFVLLGQIAERAGGNSYQRLLHSRILDPLRLAEIFLPGAETAPAPVAMSSSSFGLVSPLDRMSILSIGNMAFGLMASARDVARWGHELFTGTVISGRMQQEMRMLVPAAGNIPGESGAGLGIRGYSYLGRNQLGHSGGSSFGSSLLLHDPSSRITVVVLMNQSQGADHFALAPKLLDLALRK